VLLLTAAKVRFNSSNRRRVDEKRTLKNAMKSHQSSPTGGKPERQQLGSAAVTMAIGDKFSWEMRKLVGVLLIVGAVG
jgi:hypothetical protein